MKLVAWICPECGEQIFYKNKWGVFGHYHTKDGGWPRSGDPWIAAVKIDVEPVSKLSGLVFLTHVRDD